MANGRSGATPGLSRRGGIARLRKVESFELVLTGLLANGVNHVQGVSFRTSELRKHRDAARQMAIRAAREKADALAAELGAKRGKVHQITEWAFAGGQISVSAMVNVSFLIE